ncbi:hypothetical protein BURMUCGD1_6479 [Burkholderia multivorans CGD1]|nr:hypothetical protein BURMUCGD1_6479 [Burkholderia multivorans CGD1]
MLFCRRVHIDAGVHANARTVTRSDTMRPAPPPLGLPS